jgi:signal transduction histidine kinase
MFNKLNLTGKIILAAIATSLGLLFIGFYIIIANESRGMFEMMKKHANIITQTVQEGVRYSYFNIEASTGRLQKYAESLAGKNGIIHIEIFGPNVIVIAHTDRDKIGDKPEELHATYIKKVFIDGEMIEEILPEKGQYNIFFPVRILSWKTGKQQVVGVIELAMALRKDTAAQKTDSMKIIGTAQNRLSEHYESIRRGKAHLQSLAERLANIEGVIHIELFDKSETVIAHTIPSRIGKHARAEHRQFIKKILKDGESFISIDEDKGEFLRYMPIVIDLKGTDEVVGIIELVMDLTAVKKKIGSMRVTMMTSAIVMAVLIMIILTVLLRRIIIKPVQEFRMAAESVAKGNMDTILVVHSSDELGDLARSFNRMTSDLKVALKKFEKAKTDAEDANMIKTMFLANANHEIKTPLQSIIGLISLIRDGLHENEDERKKFARDALSASNLLAEMIENLLDLNLIESGKRKTYMSKVPVGIVIEKVNSIMWVQAKEKGIKLEFIFKNSCHSMAIWTDAGQFREVLVNLIGNALKFTDTGSIKVVCVPEEEKGEMRLDIIDTGIGIEPANQKFLFEPFVQSAATKKQSGSGLGLTVAKSLCENMGASLSIYSKGLGHGTTLTMKIPLKEQKRG